MVKQLSAQAAKALLDSNAAALLLDVRESWEVQLAAVKQPFIPLPMQLVPQSLAQLDATAPIVVLCHHGSRSMQVAMFLQQHGFDEVYNLSGGIAAWSHSVDASVAQY
jgi:rhodanese-related sulfurtransferase